jgi:hypothetical protein
MSEKYQYQGEYVANAGTQATPRKRWSNLAMATFALNALLLGHMLFSSSIIGFVLGTPAGGQEISLSEYNAHMGASLMAGSSYIVLSIVAVVVNVRFFRSLRTAAAPVTSYGQPNLAAPKTDRIKRIAAGFLIAFPSLALAIPAAHLAYILFV